MSKRNKGFTLIEVILVIFIIGICSFVVFPTTSKLYERKILESTAQKIQSTLLLAKQLSMDEVNSYCVESIDNGKGFRIRETDLMGKTIFIEKFHPSIKFYFQNNSNHKIVYNHKGMTSYGKFTIMDTKNHKIKIETLIGTGRIIISKIY
ncbi:prepilin-type N-terminal cleavage/methylation domain-containing protein [Anaerophilus nitritogenes]|uniref:prepilin-type N-terminal cleavage/methylation domain-containing protein n=1 Tax=Anaerophilus nitritogenes TaxID=2498136 RepID=UPI0013EC4296|nr:prepilin-type N-terminal cleavage/methylation domain-containing protein [Anaerophilus nitritogenes]